MGGALGDIEGGHPILDAVRDWVPSFRAEGSSAAGRTPPYIHPDVSVIESVAELHTVLQASWR